ncbi:MAG TPA: protein kinase [Candidatus Acidoferrum sp.]
MHQVGKYEIISEIGHGAMGAVYKARDPLIGRLVALKTITSGLSAQANSLERFYQEARSAGALQHPNIVTIYELGHQDNTPFIAMEYIEGRSLDQVIEERQALPLSVKLGYIVRVCEALSYAHRHNVVHRDIKPANIMVTKEGVVKVVDFGIARLTDMSLTQPNMMIGSRAYMSPQLYKGERADARADIWAVGVTLYEFLAYRRPFGGESEAELMFHILSDSPPALQPIAPDCPDELSGIVVKMLEKKAQDRYQSMEDVLRDLEPLWKSAQQATVAGLLADSQQLVAAKDLQRAQGLLRKALQIDIANTQVKSLLEKVTAELRRTQVLPKVNEHLERGRGFLQMGRLREARSEVEAALGLDSRHEPAQKLRAELEEALARAQEVEQKLRLTKQRLAEGALTEAATALASALELDAANSQAQDLRRQIDEERNRRERRKKLSEVLHRARTLWTALNYEECLDVLSAGLREFPNDPELMKLQEMARHDLDDLERQRRMGDVRKLLGQQQFAEARKIAGDLAKKYPQDLALRNLQILAQEGEQEEKKRKRFGDELAGLRTLLSSGEFDAAVKKGDALLREYPEEFELKELIGYARGEAAQQELRQSEKKIRELIQQESYREAETLARRAVREFPNQEIFGKLAEEAGEKRRALEQRERAHREIRQRIDEMSGNINQENISDAIAFAHQTLATFGPHPDVTQLMNAAALKQEELNKKELREKQFVAAKTMIDAGNFMGATQVLNQAMATQILQRSDPRVQRQLREIEQLSAASRTSPLGSRSSTAQTSGAAAATQKSGFAEARDRVVDTPGQQPMFSDSAVLKPAASEAPGRQARPLSQAQARDVTGVVAPGKPQAGGKGEQSPLVANVLDWMRNAWQSFAHRILPLLRKPAALGTVGGVAVLAVVILVVLNHGPSKNEKDLRARALQQWSSHDLDGSEQTWNQIKQLRGFYEKDATKEIKDIEDKRQQESQLFQQGETLLNDQKDYPAAAQTFRNVIQLNLWLTDKAQSDLAIAEASGVVQNASNQELQLFNQGKAFFDSKAYDQARKTFLAARDLNVPNSTLRPQIDSYLKRISQTADAKKLYEQAIADIKNEDWEGARQQLQELVDRKAPVSGEAKQRLTDISAAINAGNSFHQTLQAGAYRDAKSQLDGMPWPKTKDRLLKEMRDSENKKAVDIENRAKTLQANNDLDGIEQIAGEFHRFVGKMEDPSLTKWANEMNKWLDKEEQRLRQNQGEKAAFDAAISDFTATKEKGDANRMQKEVLPKFERIAKSSGEFHAQAEDYVAHVIPAAIQELMAKSVGPGRVVVPPISCNRGTPSGPSKPSLQSVTCAQLDSDAPLQWAQTPTVELPSSAHQPGKLPYTLRLLVFVDPSGKVKVEKDGDADNDFFKKAKDAAKHWKTTVPKSGGKPVSVSFPLAITFAR